MNRLRTVLFILGGLVLLCTLAVAIIWATLDDEDLRRLVIRSADRFTSTCMDIEGPFNLKLSANPSLSAEAIRFYPQGEHPQHPIRYIGKLSVQIALWPLVTGKLVVKDLQAEDVVIKVPIADQAVSRPAGDHEQAFFTDLVLPVFHSVQLRNIELDVIQAARDRSTEIRVHSLDLNSAGRTEPVHLSSAGTISGQAYDLVGRMGSPETLLTGDQAYPVDFSMQAAGFSLTLAGTLDHGLRGKGMHLRVSGQARELAQVLALLDLELPDLGHLSFEAVLEHDLTSPRVEHLSAELSGNPDLHFSAQGSVANAFSGQGTDIDFSGYCAVQDILNKIEPASLKVLNQISLSGSLHEADGMLSLENLKMEAVADRDASVKASGRIDLGEDIKTLTFKNMDLDIHASFPSSDMLKPLVFERIPEIGPIVSSARLTGPPESLALENIVVDAGGNGLLQVSTRGRITGQRVDNTFMLSNIDLRVSLTSPNTSQLAAAYDFKLPELGAVSATSSLRGTPGRFQIEELLAKAETARGLKTSVSGTITIQDGNQLAGVAVSLKASGPGLEALPGVTGLQLPDLGPIQMQASIASRGDSLDVDTFRVQGGKKNTPSFDLRGELRHINHPDQTVLRAAVETFSQPWVESFLDQKEARGVALKGKIEARRTGDGLRIQELSLATTDGRQLVLQVQGTLTDLLESPDLDLQCEARVQDPPVIGLITGITIPSLPPLAIKGRITGQIPDVAFQGQTRLGESVVSTRFKAGLIAGRPRIEAAMAAEVINLMDIGITPAPPPEETIPASQSSKLRTQRLFSDRPLLPFQALKAFDGWFALDVQKLIDREVSINNLDVDFRLDKGKLHIKPASLLYLSGFTDVDMLIDASGEVPEYSLKIVGEDIDIDDVLARAHEPVILSGSLNLAVDLHSAGTTAREVASNLSGDLSLALENGQIWRVIDLLSKDTFDIILTSLDQRKYTDVYCLINALHFERGVGTIEALFIDSPKIRARGAGNVNLADETLDMVINPQRKRSLLKRRSAVRIKGPLIRPSAQTLPLQEAAEIYGTIVLPFVFVPLRATGALWSLIRNDQGEKSPCIRLSLPQEQQQSDQRDSAQP